MQKRLVLIVLIIYISYSLASKQFLEDNLKNYIGNQNAVFGQSFNMTSFFMQQTNQSLLKQKHEIFGGYINIGDVPDYTQPNINKSMIFYQLYSPNNFGINTTINSLAPIILWLQGGPGSSDVMGSFSEFGPYLLNDGINFKDNSTFFIENQFTWAMENYLLFVDSPVGVGFSPLIDSETNPNYPSDSVQTAIALEYVLNKFFQIYPQLQSNPFYVCGESYGGHYVPALAAQIVSNPSSYIKNLQGVAVGDGFTDSFIQMSVLGQYYASVGIISYSTLKQFKQIQGQFIEQMLNGDVIDAQNTINNEQTILIDDTCTDKSNSFNCFLTGVNVDNYKQQGTIGPFDFNIGTWMDLPSTITNYQFPQANKTWQAPQEQSDSVGAMFTYDWAESYTNNYSVILNKGLRVLIYTGQVDANVPFNGVENMIQNINWSGMDLFRSSQKQTWTYQNPQGQTVVAGNIKISNQLFVANVYKAGHLVPKDQPESALDMITKYINNQQNWS